MLGHVSDLSSHSEDEEGQEVYNEDWPEDRHVECLSEGAGEGQQTAQCEAFPEAVLRQLPHEGLELVFVIDR